MFFITIGWIFYLIPHFTGKLSTAPAVLKGFVLATLIHGADLLADILSPVNFAFDLITAGTFLLKAGTLFTISTTSLQHFYSSPVFANIMITYLCFMIKKLKVKRGTIEQ
jgi:hypothetical protein